MCQTVQKMFEQKLTGMPQEETEIIAPIKKVKPPGRPSSNNKVNAGLGPIMSSNRETKIPSNPTTPVSVKNTSDDELTPLSGLTPVKLKKGVKRKADTTTPIPMSTPILNDSLIDVS